MRMNAEQAYGAGNLCPVLPQNLFGEEAAELHSEI
jgi:hypothetical protein